MVLWFTNSIIILSTNPVDLKIMPSLSYYSLFYSIILVIMIYYFLLNSLKDSETELRKQINNLIIGISIIVVILIFGYFGELISDITFLDTLEIFASAIAFVFIAYSMIQDISMNRIKILTSLKRSKFYLNQ